MNIGAAIKKLRLAKGWDQKNLAKKLNVSNKTISSWERNRTEPNMEMIEELCRLFECSKSDFFEETLSESQKDFLVKYDAGELGQLVIKVPKENHHLFTMLNKRAMKLSPSDLKKILGIMDAFSDESEQEESTNDRKKSKGITEIENPFTEKGDNHGFA